MNTLMATCLIVLVALMSRGGLTAPVNCYNSSDNSTGLSDATLNNSTATNVTTVNTNITTLQAEARREVYQVIQEIRELELYYGEKYNLSYQNCYVRVLTNYVDVDILREDVHFITQLVIVIEDLADNEKDAKTLNYYDEMIYGMNRSIVAINNLIAALEDNVTNDNVTEVEQNEKMEEEEEEKKEGLNTDSHATDSEITPTDVTPPEGESTDSPLKNKMDAGTEDLSETDRCMQLPKPVKLSALKLQIELTYEDIIEVYPSPSM